MIKKIKAKRRALYLYVCAKCGHKRNSRVYSRATTKICTKCRRDMVPDNQPSLFPIEKSDCPDHPDGHHFIPCDEWPATCTCGKQEYEN